MDDVYFSRSDVSAAKRYIREYPAASSGDYAEIMVRQKYSNWRCGPHRQYRERMQAAHIAAQDELGVDIPCVD